VYPDVVLAGGMSLVTGSMWAIEQQRYAPSDAALTALEGISAVRLFDIAHDGWHSLNVAAWPVMCFAWSLLLAPLPLEGNVYLHERMGMPALAVVSVLALLGVLGTGVVGLMHSDTDVFYASASSVSYRMQEFNVGINAAFLLSIRQPTALLARAVVGHAFYGLALAFAGLWWAELGVSISSVPEEANISCMRLYSRNVCLPARHALLCRGCVLGLALVCRRELPAARRGAVPEKAPHGAKTKDVEVLRVLCSAVTFCWPVFTAMRFVAHIMLGPVAVHRNSATLAAALPVVLIAVVAVYDQLIKPRVERIARRRAVRVLAAGRTAWARARECAHARWKRGRLDAAHDADTMLEAAQMLVSPSGSGAGTPIWCPAQAPVFADSPSVTDVSAELVEEYLAPQQALRGVGTAIGIEPATESVEETEHLAPQHALVYAHNQGHARIYVATAGPHI